MTSSRHRGQRPPPAKGAFTQPDKPPDYNNETPKFCLRFLRGGFDVHALDTAGQAAFAKTLQKLASSYWKDLITAPRHGQGSEFLPRDQIKAPIPTQFLDEERFLVFRYHGLLPTAGVRIRDVFHILWVEPAFGQLYKHS
jgi:hypothetical protein